MMPGPTLVIKCPNCSALHQMFTWESWNSIGAEIWTDGKIQGEMYTEPYEISQCQKCKKYFWIEDAREPVEELDFSSMDKTIIEERWEERKKWNSIVGLDVKGLSEALAEGLGNSLEREKYLRIRLWWSINDPLRKDENNDVDPELEEQFLSNLNNLSELLDKNSIDESIMLAEIQREQGNYNKCTEILSNIKFGKSFELIGITDLILQLAKDKNRKVQSTIMDELTEEIDASISKEQDKFIGEDERLAINSPPEIPKDMNLGDLFESHYMHTKHNQEIQKLQRYSGKPIWELLFEYGHSNEDDLCWFLNEKYNYTIIKPEYVPSTKEALSLLPIDFVKKYYVLPLRVKGDTYQVTMLDPTDKDVINRINEITGKSVSTGVSKKSEIEKAIAKYYSQ